MQKHMGYLGFVEPTDDRFENDIKRWEETGVAPTESWNMDKVILKFLATRLAWYDDKEQQSACLSESERKEISEIAKVFNDASEDFTGKVDYSKEWMRLGELIGGMWN